MLSLFLYLSGGLALLIGGAELLVRGASKLAGRAGISALVVGLTIVALGTSSPELAVSIQSGFGGNAGPRGIQHYGINAVFVFRVLQQKLTYIRSVKLQVFNIISGSVCPSIFNGTFHDVHPDYFSAGRF